jgi:hypothetical protein
MTRTGNGRQLQHRGSTAPIAESELVGAVLILRVAARRSSSSGVLDPTG